jgi:CHASE1-domain containing sensor protein
MLERIRHRLTLGYAAIFALILAFLSVVAVAGFASEMTVQQDDLLTQEARNQATNLLNGRTGRSSPKARPSSAGSP